MCGIAGSIRFKEKERVDREMLLEMSREMSNRGPDGEGMEILHRERVGMVHRRLAIVDLSKQARQPMANEDKSIYVVFNGEIYNHMELRNEINQIKKVTWLTDHSDTEVIIHSYEIWGIKCIKKFRGMFSFALWDEKKEKIWLVRDRLGIKPLFFSISEERINFASSLKALLVDKEQDKTIDKCAVYDFLSLLAVPAPNTLFKYIKKIPAGTCMEVDLYGKIKKYRYWDICNYAKKEKWKETEREITNELLRLLRDSAQIRKMGDVPVGVQLSGGIDSSTNLALVSENDNEVNAFTVGYKGIHNFKNENGYARFMANYCKANHHEIMIGQEEVMNLVETLKELNDDPVADPVMVSQYYIAKLAVDNGIKVIQCGEGADELFAGYTNWYDQAKYERLNHLIPMTIKKQWYKKAIKSKKYSDDKLEMFRRGADGEALFWGAGGAYLSEKRKDKLFCDSFMKEIGKHRTWDNFKHIYRKCKPIIAKDPLAWMAAVNMVFRLPDLLLARTDRACMAVSVEGRVPFLDHQLVEWGMAIPEKYKIKNKNHKYILKQALRGTIPDEVIDRKKEGFALPFSEWCEGKFGVYMKKNIEQLAENSGFFNALEVKKYMHENRGDNFAIWALFVLSLWWQRYVQQN